MKEVTKSSIWSEFGALALGSRLKKVSDCLFQQVEELYVQQGIDISSRYFPVLIQLSQQEPLCVAQIAERLELSHPAIVQTLNLMKREGLVEDHPSPTDSRKNYLYLSAKGKQIVKKLDPVWMQLWKIVNQMLSEHAPSLLTQIEQLESQLNTQSLKERFLQSGSQSQKGVDLFCWDTKYHAAFVDLNEEWLKTFFNIEPEDRRLLDFPEREIINREE